MGSTDGTVTAISNWQNETQCSPSKLFQSTTQHSSCALNRAIGAATGEILIRLDAHSKPHTNYVERIVALLQNQQAENVGGVWEIQPSSDRWMARSIAVAAAHPIGVGDAQYRFTDKPAFVDTVPFGAFYRTLIDAIGLFDETLLTNEDYEFNARIRQHGGKIWLDPQIRAVYYARGDLKALAKQYWRYGYWKWQMLRRYPETLRWRQALPPLFILGLMLSAILALFFKHFLWLFLAIIGIYAAVLLLTGLQLAIKNKEPRFIIGVPWQLLVCIFRGKWFSLGHYSPPKRNELKS